MRLTLANRSSATVTLVLEPVGEVYELPPGASRELTYTGDPTPHLTVDVAVDEVKVWQEGRGTLELRAPPP